MKKCSQSAHESLTELNITPLLDLAFVLLVIFIITTIPPVKDMDLKLPAASKHEKDPPHLAKYISVQADGNVFIDRLPVKLEDLTATLIAMREDLLKSDNREDLNVIIRGDGKAKYKQIRTVLDLCQQANLVKVDLATEALKK